MIMGLDDSCLCCLGWVNTLNHTELHLASIEYLEMLVGV
jgi:hypothetical protein